VAEPVRSSVTIVMPHMGESVVEGKILRWLKREGDAVRRDETIAEVETAKADVEIPAPADGVLGRILVPEGETAAVGAEIARLEPQPQRAAPPASAAVEPPPAPARVPAETPAAGPIPGAPPARPAARPAPGPLAPAPAPVPADHHRQLTITPVVAKLMERHGLGMEDLQAIEGTGAGGA
jgi:pyruvate dehydrogenase E2 component (dihydrolipoamide acetyltransferase)